jgi:hypothetical protein
LLEINKKKRIIFHLLIYMMEKNYKTYICYRIYKWRLHLAKRFDSNRSSSSLHRLRSWMIFIWEKTLSEGALDAGIERYFRANSIIRGQRCSFAAQNINGELFSFQSQDISFKRKNLQWK